MSKVLVSAAVAALVAGAAFAADAPKLSLTIYNSDLALVQDVRALDLPAGRSRQEFKDVSGQIRPETVSLSAAGVGIVEQNFDFDLLTPQKLMEKAVGKQVRIVRINPATGAQVAETATVLSVNEGVVLKVGDNIEVLRDDDIPTRVIFDGIPENLRARPTLSVTLDAAKAGPRQATLSYLTKGLSWKADYVALFDERAGKLDLQGWVTLTNGSGVSYRDAEVQLIAGEVNLSDNEADWTRRNYRPRSGPSVAGRETGGGQARPLADYYLYPLATRTTVADNQTKQVSFLDVKGAGARKGYSYRTYGFETMQTAQAVDVSVDFANSTTGGLGHQLPAGIVRVYVRDVAGEPKFVGENRIDHTPQGSDMSVKIGEAFDVTVQSTMVEQERVFRTRTRTKMMYVLRNARAVPVTVTVRQDGLGRDAKVSDESLKSRWQGARALTWDVPVPANGETKLTFTTEADW